MEYEDIFELLEAVRTYKLKKGECIISSNSYMGTHVGFCTADGADPSVYWTISVKNLKLSCEGRTSDEAKEILQRMRFSQNRRELLADFRSGALSLEERPQVVQSVLSEESEDPEEDAYFLRVMTGENSTVT